MEKNMRTLTLVMILALAPFVAAQAATGGSPSGSTGPGSPGGSGPGPTTGDGWTQQVSDAAWSNRSAHTSVEFKNRMWVLGGVTGSTYNADAWSSTDGANWTLETNAAPWGGRYSHASLAFNGRLWVLGGNSTGGLLNDVWSSTDGINWTLETTGAAWAPRMTHAGVVFNNRMYVIGGCVGGFNYTSDVWSSTDGVNWTAETSAAPWQERLHPGVVVYNNQLWMMGGTTPPATTGQPIASLLNDVWSSPDGINWTQVNPSALWSARTLHRVAVYEGRMWVMGGYDQYWSYTYTPFTNDTWSSTDGVTWTWENTAAPWTPRESHAVLTFDNRIWMLGGNAYGGLDNSVWSYEETAPVITSTPPAQVAPGSLYSYDITTTGYPAPTLGASGLPAWLSLNGSTLSGTPASSDAGLSGTITITATNSKGNDTQSFQILVEGPPVISSVPVTTATVGALYSYTVTASGAPVPTLTASGLPGWLSFDTFSGELHGTPDVADGGTSAVITITASNGIAPDAVQTFTVEVSNAMSTGGGDAAAGGCVANGGAGWLLITLPLLLVGLRVRKEVRA